jgi:hypothetical protein
MRSRRHPLSQAAAKACLTRKTGADWRIAKPVSKISSAICCLESLIAKRLGNAQLPRGLNFLADFPDCPIVMTVICRGSAK